MIRPSTATVRLLICGFGPFPGFPDNPAARVVERLRAANWAPEALAVDYQLIPTTWEGAYKTVAEAIVRTDPDAVLLLGVAGGADSFRVESRAHNRTAADKADAAGACHPTPVISPRGPDVALAAIAVEPMVRGLSDAGLPVRASSDAGDYLCNYVFYRLLNGDGPPAAFLHLPPDLAPEAVERGVKAAVAAMGDGMKET